MLFQALDKQTGRLVALRRFFLGDDVLKELKTKGEDGKSHFESSLDWLKSLQVPNLQKVLGGGIDALDDTPYLVSEWVEGLSLEEAHDQQSFAPGEGELLEAQARAVLLALPEETRPAISLEEEEILVKRDAAGGLESIFLISPLRYFGALGGMEVKEQDRQAALVELRSRFPESAGAETPATPAVAMPELKSAQQSSGLGLIWGALAAVLVVAGVGGWLVMSKGGDAEKELSAVQNGAEQVAKEEAIVEAGEVAVIEEERPEKITEQPGTSVAAMSSSEQSRADKVAEQVRKAQEALEEKPVAMSPPNLEDFKVEEKKKEGEVDLFGEEEEKAELAKAPSAEPKNPQLPVIQSATEVEKFREFIGKPVLLEGVVERVDHSGGKKTIWYLEFNKGTPDFMMVAFKHVDDKKGRGTYGEWQSLTNKKVRVKGVAQTINRGGRRPALILKRRVGLKVLADMTVREVSELPGLFQSGKAEGEMVAEGTLAGFGKTDQSGYLIFEETPDAQARFLFESDFGSSQEFKSRLGSMKGKKIRVTGPLQEDPQAAVKVALQIESPENVVLVE